MDGYWRECLKRTAKGTAAFANDWQWVFGAPAASVGLGVYIASSQGATEMMTTGRPWLDAFVAALAAFVLTWIVAFVLNFFRTVPKMFAEEKERADQLAGRLSPKIRLSLKDDPVAGRGIEIGENKDGLDLPYVQVCAESINDANIYEPVANVTKVEYRLNEQAEFTEIITESATSAWSRQTGPGIKLSRGKPLRFNLIWFADDLTAPQDAVSLPSFRLIRFYEKTGKQGHYRYRVHVDGRDADPAEAYVHVKWSGSRYPTVEIEQISK